jgi:hypothetical protein
MMTLAALAANPRSNEERGFDLEHVGSVSIQRKALQKCRAFEYFRKN